MVHPKSKHLLMLMSELCFRLGPISTFVHVNSTVEVIAVIVPSGDKTSLFNG